MASLPLQNVPHLSRSRLSVPSQQSQVRREKKRRPCPSLPPFPAAPHRPPRPPGAAPPPPPPPPAPPPLSAMSLGACRRRLGSTVVGREAEGGADPQPSGPALPRLTKRHYQGGRNRDGVL